MAHRGLIVLDGRVAARYGQKILDRINGGPSKILPPGGVF